MKYGALVFLLLVTTACGKPQRDPERSVIETCKSAHDHVRQIDIRGSFELSDEQVEELCACSAGATLSQMIPSVRETYAVELDNTLDEFIEIMDRIVIDGEGDPRLLASEIASSSSPAKLAVVIGILQSYGTCAQNQGIDFPLMFASENSNASSSDDPSAALEKLLERRD